MNASSIVTIVSCAVLLVSLVTMAMATSPAVKVASLVIAVVAFLSTVVASGIAIGQLGDDDQGDSDSEGQGQQGEGEPTMLELARAQVAPTWATVVSTCSGLAGDTTPDGALDPAAVKTCRGRSDSDRTSSTLTGLSGMRDGMNTFKNVYPVPKAFAHLLGLMADGYGLLGDYLDDQTTEASKAGAATFTDKFTAMLGEDGSKVVPFEPLKRNGVTWNEYATLSDSVFKAAPLPHKKGVRHGKTSAQFWGKVDAPDIRKGYTSLRALSALQAARVRDLFAQLEDVQSLATVDTTSPAQVQTLEDGTHHFVDTPEHALYHNFRKAMRQYTRLLSFYPEINPVSSWPALNETDSVRPPQGYIDFVSALTALGGAHQKGDLNDQLGTINDLFEQTLKPLLNIVLNKKVVEPVEAAAVEQVRSDIDAMWMALKPTLSVVPQQMDALAGTKTKEKEVK